MISKIALGVLGAAALAVLICAFKTKKPFKVFIWSGCLGIAALAVLSLTGYFLDIGLEFNLYTLVSSFVFGLPGVITMLITKVIWVS